MTRFKVIRTMCVLASAMCLLPSVALAAPDVPGFTFETYVLLPGLPGRLSFDFDDVPGTLYVGRGGAFEELIPAFKIPPGGPAVEFGNTLLPDTDVVLYDSTGAFAPQPGSVLVGGHPGYISAILPTGDIVSIFPPGSGFSNPNAMGFDSTGCLLFLDTPGGRILRTCSSEEIPTLLFEPPEDATHMAIHSSDWVFVSTRIGFEEGAIWAYCSGELHQLVSGLDLSSSNSMPIAFSPGGAWGTDVLYAVSGTELLSFEFDFSACPPQLIHTATIGTGFDGVYCDIAFGPDGALYISDCFQSAVFRLVSDCNGNGINDECDIDCGSTGGLCDLPGCGTSHDSNSNGIPDECEDSDGDGVPDDEDDCPNSDLSPEIVIDGCDTGVENQMLDDGCTMADLIMQCAEDAVDHGAFVRCVSHLTNLWKCQGIINGGEKGAIMSCAGQSSLP